MTRLPPFRSDNIAGVCPEVMEALLRANHGRAAAYGNDELSIALDNAMSELFERRCRCFPVGTGTAANALALSAVSKPGSLIACHGEAHILRNEDGATQHFTPGVELVPVSGEAGRIAVDALAAFARDAEHGRWSALSLTQLTEAGTVYGREELAALAEVARRQGAHVHIDGARFANAAAALNCPPADLTWRSGVDVLSFGATKNGAMNTDAIVAFEPELSQRLEARLKQVGQLSSKMRFAAAQLLALVEDDLWLRNARHANMMAGRLAEGVRRMGVEVVHPVDGNHVIIRLEQHQADKLDKAQAKPWRSGTGPAGEPIFRLVTSFDTDPTDIEQFVSLLR